MKKTTRSIAVALAGASLALAAHAGRPLQTEDAGVLERGACELEGATERVSVSGASARGSSLQFGCGVGLQSQVALAAATAKAGGESSRGLVLVGKTALWNSGDADAALTLAWGLQWAKADGDGWRHASTDFNLVYSRPLPADLTLHANLGHSRDQVAGKRGTSWAIAVEHAGFGAFAPMAEIFGDDHGQSWWNLGLRIAAVPEKVFFDLSTGRQFGAERARLVTLGFRLAF